MSGPSPGSRLIDVEVESLDLDGNGVGRYQQRSITIPNVMPGERVRVEVPPQTARARIARLVELLRPSPHRVVPRCQHFGVCGGCSWQHIEYAEQLRIKTGIVDRLVRGAVPDAPAARMTLSSVPRHDPWGYRGKVHFVFGSTDGRGGRGLAMGHYARGSRRVIDVRECPVHDPRGNALAFETRDRFRSAGLSPATPAAGSRPGTGRASGPAGVLKGVAIRVGRATGQMLATLIVEADSDRRLRSATRALMASREDVTGLHVNLHPRDDGFIFGADTRHIAGSRRLREEVGGVSFLISPTSFFQTNVEAARLLVELVLQEVPRGAAVLDLYAGAGLFALPLVRHGHAVIAVESSRGAVADAEASLRLNRLPEDRCRFIPRPVEAALRTLRGADVVVLDPPREGCSPGVTQDVFGRLQPNVAVYVSCNPDTLARDLASAAALGYQVRSIQPVDMFPHTPHIETVVVLVSESRRAAARPPLRPRPAR
jgi:23S rRNA (uracil1939-C5)-methyltransferase